MNNPWNLPPRQVELLDLLAGAANGNTKVAAKQLGIDTRTAETHLARCYRTMGVSNRLHAVLLWDRTQRPTLQDMGDLPEPRPEFERLFDTCCTCRGLGFTRKAA